MGLRIEQSQEHGDEVRDRGHPVHLSIEIGHDLRGAGSWSHEIADRRTDPAHENTGGHALARRVGDAQGDPSVGHREMIEQIAADFS